jgi:hypothetical protein
MERRLDINLLPPEFLPQPAIRWHPIYLSLLYALSVFLVLYIGLLSLNRVKSLEVDVREAQGDVSRMEPFAKAYDLAEESVKSLENMKRLFVYLERNYVDWPLFFHHLKPNLPKGIWLVQVESSAVTKAPPTKKKAQTEEGEEEGEPGVPMHTGDVNLQGMINGYSLLPLSALIKNLQDDPYFEEPYLLGSELQENEDGVVRWFEVSVRVSVPEPDDEGGEAK